MLKQSQNLEKEKRCFCVVNSLSGLTCPLEPLLQYLADETARAGRKEMRKALLKYYLLLLTFSVWSQLANSTKENCHSEWQPFRGLPCPAHKGKTAPGRRGWQGDLSQMPGELHTCLLLAQMAAVTVVWSCMALSSLLTSIPACHLADRICKRKRSQLKPRLFSKISNFLCSRQQDSAYMRVPERGCASEFRVVHTCDQARQKATDKLHFEQGLPVVNYLQSISEWM